MKHSGLNLGSDNFTVYLVRDCIHYKSNSRTSFFFFQLDSSFLLFNRICPLEEDFSTLAQLTFEAVKLILFGGRFCAFSSSPGPYPLDASGTHTFSSRDN